MGMRHFFLNGQVEFEFVSLAEEISFWNIFSAVEVHFSTTKKLWKIH